MATQSNATNAIRKIADNPGGFKPEPFSRHLRSPSPRPSPPGRGRTISSAGIGSPFRDFSRRAHWGFPLLGERVRVRASVASDCMDTAYGTERMRQKLLVVVTGGLVKVITPLMLMVFVS